MQDGVLGQSAAGLRVEGLLSESWEGTGCWSVSALDML